MSDARERILLVDDDPNILAGYTRTLRRHYTVETAPGGDAGLASIAGHGPFSVVVSDMRMPGMDGVQFLSQVRRQAPQTVRMMLTGNADQQTAIEAVNEGHIFRFISKPCPPERLLKNLFAGCQQYRLVTAERELLEKTLQGSVGILAEVLSLVSPAAFGRAQRLKRYVHHLATVLDPESAWQYELAALLSQLGCVSLPPDLIAHFNDGVQLSPDEERLFAAHPAVGGRLIEKIPRLETVARIVARQLQPYGSQPDATVDGATDTVAMGAQLLRVAVDYDLRTSRGESCRAALAAMHERAGEYNPRLLGLLEPLGGELEDVEIRAVRLAELTCVMTVHEPITAVNGMTLVGKGQAITMSVLERLHGFHQGMGVIEPILVRVPRTVAAPSTAPDAASPQGESAPAAAGVTPAAPVPAGDVTARILASLSGFSARNNPDG